MAHVLHVTDVTPPGLGGIETALATLIESMPDIRATLIAPKRRNGTPARWGSNVEVRPIEVGGAIGSVVSGLLPSQKRSYAGLATWLINEWCRRRVTSNLDADLVHLHSFSAFRYFANLRFRYPSPLSERLVNWLRSFDRYGHPVLFTDHSLFGGTRSQFDSIRNDLLVERLANVVCVEQSGKANVDTVAQERSLGTRTWWVPNPVDTETFRPTPFPEGDRLVVGYAGRYERKGTDQILRLAADAPDWIDFRMAISAREHQIKAGATLGRLGTRVVWNLPYDRMPEFYSSIHLFVDPWSFGAPRTSLEALACGRPVIRLPGDGHVSSELPHSVSPIVDASTTTALFREVARFRDRGVLEAVGRAARQLAEQTYSVRKVVEAYRRIYATVAEGTV